MRFLTSILFLVMIMVGHATEHSLRALCFVYNGRISDKPIANVILAANKEDASGVKAEMLRKKLLVNEKFYVELIVSSEELKSFKSMETSLKERNKGNLIIVFYYFDGLKVYKYSNKEGLKVVKTLIMPVNDELQKKIQRVFINRIEGVNLNP